MTKHTTSFTAPENDGVHLHSLIERTGCGIHKVYAGTPCYTLPNNVDPETDYVAACGSRIKKVFTGRISPQSMRSEAPRGKTGRGDKRRFDKKTGKKQTASRGKN